MARHVSTDRKTAYYLGGALVAIGFLLFGSVFVTAALNFGSFDDFDGQVRSSAIRAVLGMGLMIGGGMVRNVGARGLAGSGVVLDPERARDDLEPYSRMTGGMVRDGLDEAGIDVGRRANTPVRVVMIKCLACGKLNEEDSKFCQECGRPL